MTKTEPQKAPPGMDPMLRLAAKLDKILAEMPEDQRQWALSWLRTKYPTKEKE